MNTPNKLTLLRVCLVPVFLVFLMIDQIPMHYLFAVIVFIAASLTDLFDGYLARKNNQVTTFGKFLDPLADKVLVIAAMVCFIELGVASAIAVIIIIAREFMVTSLRLVASASEGNVIAANKFGKIKTIMQMTAIITIMVGLAYNDLFTLPSFINLPLISHILMWICAAVTVASGIEYLVQNRSTVNTTK